MAKKYITIDPSEFLNTTQLTGISTEIKPYMLCHFINKSKKFDFFKLNESQEHKGYIPSIKKWINFPTYVYHNESECFKIYLIQNKVTEGVLVPELANIDYICLANTEIHPLILDDLIHLTRAIKGVNFVANFNISQLKSIENLYLDQD